MDLVAVFLVILSDSEESARLMVWLILRQKPQNDNSIDE